jgi:CheY-like chemotaxis protein
LARKILLADDSVTAQNMGRKILADAGYEVTTVNNGSAALKKIAESRPDLIVLDVYMPGYSGLEVCQRLKETGETARIPILLTVGKLEPFKPEEAKRVRAEGFIVKPFEASELLSALTKLEDKMVPRMDSSKPGRFARAIAAVEESRFDNTVSIEEDSGWKHRISFPSKKKEKKAEPEDGDDPAIYNAVNKDLRTTVEHKGSHASAEPRADAPVNLGALAPEGLPKDVTPEEIAALAAAAAQVAKIAEGKETELPAAPVTHAEVETTAPEAQPSASTATSDTKPGSEPASASATIAAEPQAEETQAVSAEVANHEALTSGATFADSKPEQDTQQQAGEIASPSGQNPEPGQDLEAGHAPEPEPITIAASSEVRGGRSSRWTAVAVALSPEEIGVSIEDEMRQAYAAFVGAHASATTPREVPVSIPEIQAEPAPSSLATPPQSSDVVMSESSQTFGAASETTQAWMAVSGEPVEARGAGAVEAGEPTIARAAVAQPTSSSECVPSPSAEPPVSNFERDKENLGPVVAQETKEASLASGSNEPAAVDQTEASQPGPASAAPPDHPSMPELPEQSIASISSANSSTGSEQATTIEASAEPSKAEAATPELESGNAAWASWRRIRESGDAPTQTAEPARDAAMAVAAGAEKTPQDAAAESDEAPEIASIVDSVLADLRPKIVAEISRKLGKKK